MRFRSQIALSMAEEHGIDLPEAAAFAGAAMSGIHKGWGDLDFSCIARHYGYPNDENVLPEDVFAPVKAKPGENGTDAPRKHRKKRFLFFGRRE